MNEHKKLVPGIMDWLILIDQLEVVHWPCWSAQFSRQSLLFALILASLPAFDSLILA